jgi:LysR family hydrogen peroxide-inducible transcriptional activator
LIRRNRFFRWHRLEITADKSVAIAFNVLAADTGAMYFRTRCRERRDAQAVSGFQTTSRWTNEGRMSIRALRYLIALAECLNFTRAAERCSISQSTLSIQLRKLEEYLGVRLFERDRAHVALTEDGRKVLRFARVAVRAADRIVSVSRARATSSTELLIEEINCQRVSID